MRFRTARRWFACGNFLVCATAAQAQESPNAPSPVASPTDKAGYTLFDPTPREALRELSTDRPDKTESPYTVDAGHFQVELDFATYTIDRDKTNGANARAESLNVAPINLKMGLTNDTDLQVIVDSYIHRTVTDRVANNRQRIDGFGDVTLRLKHNLWGNDGGRAAFALMPFVKLPTNSNGLGNAAVEGGLIAPLAITLPGQFDLGFMTEVDLLRNDADSGYSASFVNSATVSHGLTDRLGMYVEVFTEKRGEKNSHWVATLDSGLTYAIGKNAQLDLGVNLGVTEAADDLNLFVGLSRRF